MKHSIKISVMALVAMFAVSTTADAQFGLLKSIGKDLGIKGKKKVKDPKTGETIKIKEDEFVVRNWKTGEDEIVKNPFPEARPWSNLLETEKNFQDKAMKKKIIERLLDEEKFNNRKRKSDDIMKDRKVVYVLFRNDEWTNQRNDYGSLTNRYLVCDVISELTNGMTIDEYTYVNNKYSGGGDWSENFVFVVQQNAATMTTSAYKEVHLVTDWEHKEDADPLKDL